MVSRWPELIRGDIDLVPRNTNTLAITRTRFFHLCTRMLYRVRRIVHWQWGRKFNGTVPTGDDNIAWPSHPNRFKHSKGARKRLRTSHWYVMYAVKKAYHVINPEEIYYNYVIDQPVFLPLSIRTVSFTHVPSPKLPSSYITSHGRSPSFSFPLASWGARPQKRHLNSAIFTGPADRLGLRPLTPS